MCLWLFNSRRCPEWFDCATCGCACAILAPFCGLVGFLAGLGMGLVKWIPGSCHRIGASCASYWAVVREGQRAYDVEAGRARRRRRNDRRASVEAARTLPSLTTTCPVVVVVSRLCLMHDPTAQAPAPPAPPAYTMADAVAQSLEWHARHGPETRSKCLGEMYCCCCPCFVVGTVLIPVFVLVDLLVCVAVFRGLCGGACGPTGCGPCRGFGPRFLDFLRDLDRLTSFSAFGTSDRCRFFTIVAPPTGVPPAPAPPGTAPSAPPHYYAGGGGGDAPSHHAPPFGDPYYQTTAGGVVQQGIPVAVPQQQQHVPVVYAQPIVA